MDSPEDPTGEATAQIGFYTHLGLDGQVSSSSRGALSPATLPGLVLEISCTDPRDRHRKLRKSSR